MNPMRNKLITQGTFLKRQVWERKGMVYFRNHYIVTLKNKIFGSGRLFYEF